MTAVEYLVKELNQKIDFIPMDKWDMIRDIVQQALEMEKEQIFKVWNYLNQEGWGTTEKENIKTFEQYYFETYKTDKL